MMCIKIISCCVLHFRKNLPLLVVKEPTIMLSQWLDMATMSHHSWETRLNWSATWGEFPSWTGWAFASVKQTKRLLWLLIWISMDLFLSLRAFSWPQKTWRIKVRWGKKARLQHWAGDQSINFCKAALWNLSQAIFNARKDIGEHNRFQVFLYFVALLFILTDLECTLYAEEDI